MQTVTFVHIQNKQKWITNMNLVIQCLNFQISNLLPKNATKLTNKHSHLENAFCNLAIWKQDLQNQWWTLEMLFMQNRRNAWTHLSNWNCAPENFTLHSWNYTQNLRHVQKFENSFFALSRANFASTNAIVQVQNIFPYPPANVNTEFQSLKNTSLHRTTHSSNFVFLEAHLKVWKFIFCIF